jgi:hypothetical protein
MSIIYNASSVVSGLVLHYDAASVKSYPGTGSTWYDLSGNANHGTISSGEFVGAGGYLQNAGNVSNFFTVSVADSTSLSSALKSTNGAWTIEESVYTYSVNYPESDAGTVVSSTGYGAGAVGFDWNHGIGNTQFQFGVTNNPASGYSDQVTIGLNAPYSNLNYWKLRTMIWNRMNNTVSLYINGVYQGNGSTPNTAGKALYDGGGIVFGSLYGWKHYGRRSLIRIYNRDLSTQEIQQNFTAIRGRFGL